MARRPLLPPSEPRPLRDVDVPSPRDPGAPEDAGIGVSVLFAIGIIILFTVLAVAAAVTDEETREERNDRLSGECLSHGGVVYLDEHGRFDGCRYGAGR